MYLDRQDLLTNKIVVSIPMQLENREAIASSLFDRYGKDYVFLGEVFQDKTTELSCLINIRDRHKWTEDNGDLVRSFKLLGQDRLSHTTLKQIDNCQQIVCLICDRVGYDACLKIAKFTQVFLNIGGVAVKIDSAENVCDRYKWLANYNSDDVFDIYSLFVTLVRGDNCYYSCGMNNFGKADVSIDTTEDINLAIYVMNVFNYYRLTESVILQEGQTFQPDLECPMYQIQWRECNYSEANNPLHNSYGIWHLSLANNIDITYQIN